MLDGEESGVGVVQRKFRDAGLDVEVVRDLEEVAGVVAGHVGDAANLTLAPEKLVVVEGVHLVEMDGVDGDDATFAQAGERVDDNFTDWRKGDGAVERDGGLVIFLPYPRGS